MSQPHLQSPEGERLPLLSGDGGDGGGTVAMLGEEKENKKKPERLVSLDVFRGFTILLMIFVDDIGEAYPSIDHSPWNNITLADFVMPFFLWIVGVSMSLAFRTATNPKELVKRITIRSIKLFVIGLFVQGGHTPNPITCARTGIVGYDLKRLRIMGILQRIAIAFFIVGVCETVLPKLHTASTSSPTTVFKKYAAHWGVAILLQVIFLGMMFGVDVPGCGRGVLTPLCNACGYIDSLMFGEDHLYKSATYVRLPDCSSCSPGYCPLPGAPSWCTKPFDPEGFVATISATSSTFIGIHYGRVLNHYPNHNIRLAHWLGFSLACLVPGLVVHFTFMPMNKNLFSLSYVLFMAAVAGAGLSACYFVIDVKGYARPLTFLSWVGKNAILVFFFAASDKFNTLLGWVYYDVPTNTLPLVMRRYMLDSWMDEQASTMVYVWGKMIFWTGVCWYLDRIKYYWKV